MLRLTLILIFLNLVRSHAGIYERFEQDGKVGIKDDQGHVVLAATFDALGWSDGSFSLVGQITGYRQGNRWGLLNLKKKFITKALYQTLTCPGGSRLLVSKEINAFTTKFGCIDLKGQLVIPLSYDEIRIHDLRAIVMIKNGVRYEHGLIDLNNRIVLPLAYKQIVPLGTLRYAVHDFEGKTALCSEEGKWSTGFDIDSISAFSNDLAIFYRGWRRGVIDRSGEIKLEALYREVTIENPGAIKLRKADAWKVVDVQHHILRQIEADELIPLGPNRTKVTINGRSGLVDSLFRAVLPMNYDYMDRPVNEMLVVGSKNEYGLLRTDQSVVLPLAFDSLIVSGHLIRARTYKEGKMTWDLYDTVGIKKSMSSYEEMGAFNGKFFPVRKGGYVGAMDRMGKEIIACVYDSVLETNDALCAVKFKGNYGIITHDDQWKLTPQKYAIRLLPGERFMERQGTMQFMKDFEGQIIYFTDNPLIIYSNHLIERLPDGGEKEINYLGQMISRKAAEVIKTEKASMESEGLTAIFRDGKYGFVDSRGRLRIANRYEAVDNFHEGLAAVRLLGKWGFIDKSDQIIIQPTFDKPATFEHGVALVTRNGKAGLIDRKGSVLLALRYDSLRQLEDGHFILALGPLRGLADAKGNVLIETRFDTLIRAGRDFVIVSQDKRFGLLTTEGLSVIPLQYHWLRYLPDSGTFFAHQVFDWESHEVK